MFITVQPNGLLIESVDAFQPPTKKLESLCAQVAKACSVTFTNECEGNNDDHTLFYPFTEELSEEQFEQMEEFVNELNLRIDTLTIEELLSQLATTARSGCQEILGRDFSDNEKLRLSRGYEALEKEIRGILEGEVVAYQVTEVLGPAEPRQGATPRVIDSIQIILGKDTLTAQEIHDKLKKRRWLPNSKDPLGYIVFTLKSEGKIFIHSGDRPRKYHLDPSNPYYSGGGSPTSMAAKKRKSKQP